MRTGSWAHSIPVACAALCVLLAPRVASASWPPFGRAICTAPGDQAPPAITSDGSGGAVLAWVDSRDPIVNLYALRVLASGDLDPAWPADGRILMTDPAAISDAIESPAFPVIVADGSGGAIVAWQHGRSSVTGTDIFAQHILAAGAVDPAWPANGVPVCVVTGIQDNPTIAADGTGGAVITWMDGRSSATSIDVYAQHVLSAGMVDPAWPVNGRALCNAPAPQAFPTIVSDGGGGAIVTWYDFRSSVTSLDIYAEHVLSSGVMDPEWPVNGRALCTAPGSQSDPQIVPDGARGAIVAWQDARTGVNHVFAQHVLSTGSVDPRWPADGRAVSNGPVEEVSPRIVSDSAGGAIVTFQDARNGHHNVYAEHVLTSGFVDPTWPIGGTALSLSSTEQVGSRSVSDGAGGALVSWQDGFDVLAQHVLATGVLDPAFPSNGRGISILPSVERDPAMVATGGGGAIVTWLDFRRGGESDIYAIQVLSAATTDVPTTSAPIGISFAGPSPNPTNGSATLRFSLSREAHVSLSIHDAGGRRVRELASGVHPAGEREVRWDLRDQEGHAVSAGVYFVRLTVNGLTTAAKLIALR